MAHHDAAGGPLWSTEILRTDTGLGMRKLADAFESRGAQYVTAGTDLDAVRCYAASASHHRRMGPGWPRYPGTAGRLDHLQRQLAAADYRRAWASGERLDLSELAADWL